MRQARREDNAVAAAFDRKAALAALDRRCVPSPIHRRPADARTDVAGTRWVPCPPPRLTAARAHRPHRAPVAPQLARPHCRRRRGAAARRSCAAASITPLAACRPVPQAAVDCEVRLSCLRKGPTAPERFVRDACVKIMFSIFGNSVLRRKWFVVRDHNPPPCQYC